MALRDRILTLVRHGDYDPIHLATLLDVDPSVVAQVLATPSYTPPAPPSGGGSTLTWTSITSGFANNWTPDATSPLQWAVDATGTIAYLRGKVNGQSGSATGPPLDICPLPNAIKPAIDRNMVVAGKTAPGQCVALASGWLDIVSGDYHYLCFDGVSYPLGRTSA